MPLAAPLSSMASLSPYCSAAFTAPSLIQLEEQQNPTSSVSEKNNIQQGETTATETTHDARWPWLHMLCSVSAFTSSREEKRKRQAGLHLSQAPKHMTLC